MSHRRAISDLSPDSTTAAQVELGTAATGEQSLCPKGFEMQIGNPRFGLIIPDRLLCKHRFQALVWVSGR